MYLSLPCTVITFPSRNFLQLLNPLVWLDLSDSETLYGRHHTWKCHAKSIRSCSFYVLIIRKVSYRQYYTAVGIIKGIIPSIATIRWGQITLFLSPSIKLYTNLYGQGVVRVWLGTSITYRWKHSGTCLIMQLVAHVKLWQIRYILHAAHSTKKLLFLDSLHCLFVVCCCLFVVCLFVVCCCLPSAFTMKKG